MRAKIAGIMALLACAFLVAACDETPQQIAISVPAPITLVGQTYTVVNETGVLIFLQAATMYAGETRNFTDLPREDTGKKQYEFVALTVQQSPRGVGQPLYLVRLGPDRMGEGYTGEVIACYLPTWQEMQNMGWVIRIVPNMKDGLRLDGTPCSIPEKQ